MARSSSSYPFLKKASFSSTERWALPDKSSSKTSSPLRMVLRVNRKICHIFEARFYDQDALPFSLLGHFTAVQELCRYLLTGCVLHRWHHELVALFRWTTAPALGSRSVDSRCSSYCHPSCDRLVSGIAATF